MPGENGAPGSPAELLRRLADLEARLASIETWVGHLEAFAEREMHRDAVTDPTDTREA